MASPSLDPATPADTEALIDLQHQLDIANDYRTLRSQSRGTHAPEADSGPASEPDPPPDMTAMKDGH